MKSSATSFCSLRKKVKKAFYSFVTLLVLFLTVNILYLTVNILYAQPSSQFQAIYGGSGQDRAYSVITTQDGGYAITGFTTTFGAGNTDVYVIKLDANGAVEWSKTFGGSNLDKGYSIQQTDDGGYIIGGETRTFGQGNQDLFLIRLDQNGNFLWSKVHGLIGFEYTRNIRQTKDGGFISTGYASAGFGQNDFLLVRMDSAGDILWSKGYGHTTNDFPHHIDLTSDGGFIITGYRRLNLANREVYLLKTDSLGNVEFAKTYSGPNLDLGFGVLQIGFLCSADKGFIIVAITNSFGAGGNDVLLIKTDSIGNLQWAKTYGGTGNDDGYTILQKQNGDYLLAGITNSFGSGLTDLYLLNVDNSGNLLFSRTYGGSNIDAAIALDNIIQITPDGGIVFAGWTNSFGFGSDDFYIIKADSSGFSGCNQTDNPPTIVNTPSINVTNIFPAMVSLSLASISPPLVITIPATLDSMLCLQAELSISDTTITNTSCDTCSDGAIDITITGGETPYSFIWSNGATTEDINNLTVGVYIVTVTDFIGDSVTSVITVFSPNVTCWTGSLSGDWNDLNNWTEGTPDKNDPVIIGDANATGTLVITLSNGKPAEMGSLELGTGLIDVTIIADQYKLTINGDLTIGIRGTVTNTTNNVYVKGDMTVKGTYDPGNNSTTIKKGANNQVLSGNLTFYDLKLMSFQNNIILESDLLVKNELNIAQGTFVAKDNEIRVGGDWIDNANFDAGTSTVIFNGTANQNITKNGGEETFYGLIINTTGGTINLGSPVAVNNNLTLTSGNINTTNSNILTIKDNAVASGASNASFVSGPMVKVGDDSFTFPIGKNGFYHPLSISAPNSITDALIAEYIDVGQGFGFNLDIPLQSISDCEYWTLKQLSGNSNVKVTLRWNVNSCNINNLLSLRVAAWDGSQWIDKGGEGVSGNLISGNISSRDFIDPQVPPPPGVPALLIATILPTNTYVVLKKRLDGGYYLTISNKLFFKYYEEYNVASSSKLTYNIYDNTRTLVGGVDNTGATIIVGSPNPQVQYGDNRYGDNSGFEMDISTITPSLIIDAFYTLEVVNKKGEKWYLRFKYGT